MSIDDKFNKNCLVWKINDIKRSENIAIGGMISAGKTTIVNYLNEKYNYNPVYELDNDKNSLMNILLSHMYKRERIAQAVCQTHFLLNRYSFYEKANKEKDKKFVFDRTIFEDRLFAFYNMLDQPTYFEFYEKLWRDKINELIYNVGIPRLYIILDINWDNFKKRLFERNREMEVANFSKNEDYFKMLNRSYTKYLQNICSTYCIPHITIDANQPIEIVKKLIDDEMKKLN